MSVGTPFQKIMAKFFPRKPKIGQDTVKVSGSQVERSAYSDVASPLIFQQYFLQYKKNSWIHSAVNMTTASCLAVPIKLRYRTSKDLISPTEIEPIGAVLKYPNPHMTQIELLEKLYLHLEVCGNAFWELVVDPQTGRLMAIYPLDPMQMSIIPDERDYIAGYRYTGGKRDVVFEPNDIVHFRYPDPTNEYWGLAPVAIMMRQARLEDKMFAFGEKYFDNDATPSGVLKTDRILSDPSYERIRKRWNDRHKGLGNKFSTAILEDGMTYEKISAPMSDIDYTVIKEHLRDEMLVSGAVPPTLLGVPGATNYASARVAQSMFFDSNIAPRLRKVASIADKEIMNRFAPHVEVVFDTSVSQINVIKLSANSRVISRLWQMSLMSKNEARSFIGLPPVIDGDKFSDGSIKTSGAGLIPTASTGEDEGSD